MIKLDVMPYCNECPRFNPCTEGPELYTYNDFCSSKTVIGDTIIRCSNHKQCLMMYEYLKGERK